MIVIVRVEGENAIITDEAGRFLDRPCAGRVLPRFAKDEQRVAASGLVGFFEATYEHGNLELGDRIRKAP